ncbi:MAG TPA: M81 family metallopeptidase [Pyrinomonadaceae bacterium]
MKILVGGIYHESHSFSHLPTDLETFRQTLLLEGDEVIDKLRGTTSEMAGFIEGSKRFGFDLVPTIWAWAVSAGPVQQSTLNCLLELVQRRIASNGGIGGVLFALHGALVGETELDGDGEILSALRNLVGESIPIAVTVDLHANISPRMVELADVIVGYDSYPHVDQVERGLEAAELLAGMLSGEIKPVMALEKPPMILVPQKQFTSAYPMSELIKMAHEYEREVLSVTISGGFAYADVPEIGLSVLVITDDQLELARGRARQIADRAWQLREDFLPKLPTVQDAVSRAIQTDRWPVILADVGDNIGAGTPGDGTVILQELIDQKARGAVVTIADDEAVSQALEAGVGQEVTLDVGGKSDSYHGKPIRLKARVRLVSDGVFVNRGHMRDGITENMGRTVVLESDEIKVVLTEIKMPPWNLEQLRSVGIAPEREKIIVLKSAIAFRAAYEPIAHEIIEVNSPGLSSLDLSQFSYKSVRRPIFPLDEF